MPIATVRGVRNQTYDRIYGMCGVAGYSVDGASGLQRTLAAQALLAGIAERGSDAVGYAVRTVDGQLEIV
jgi:hypothetical protein